MVDRARAFEGLMVLTGIALVIAGLNGQFSLVVAGGALVFLAVMSRMRNRSSA